MIKLTWIILVIFMIGITTLINAGPSPAQSYELTWWKISGGGGGSAANNSFTISGTIGQPEAGFLLGDKYTLTGGFWGKDFYQLIYLPVILRN